MSVWSSICLATGLPTPCPAFPSMRIRIGRSLSPFGLQPRRHLAGVQRVDAGVALGGDEQHGRVGVPVVTWWYGE